MRQARPRRKCEKCRGEGVIRSVTGRQYCAGCDTHYDNDMISHDFLAGRQCPKGHAGWQVVPEVIERPCTCQRP